MVTLLQIYSSEGFYSGDIEVSLGENFNEKPSVVGIVFKLNGEDVGITGNIYAEFI